MIVIEKETAADAAAIESLLDIGFGPDRMGKTVYQLRVGQPLPELSLVARTGFDARVGASIRYWPIDVKDGRKTIPALVLGPLVVDPELQGKGLGRTLVARSLEEADQDGWTLCLVVGEPSYYEPYGFIPAEPYGFELPGPVEQRRFQVRGTPEILEALLATKRKRPVRPWSGKASGVENISGTIHAA
ncbi:MAG: N-acetyltransferase [Nisaea sp.]|jgi:predicted N-acetyltransferase YhbS|uniref:GNAT family N-acetyltransferase n=1 Tax=Nisaea sp. TaxID=2024842 RepID=UPI001B245D4B|nr:N-acetyltransferase [Nisaea sp.]MBO6559504.1 N-acetyltransferase [Nisaea sp.]